MQNPVAMFHTFDTGDDLFAPQMKRLSLRAIAMNRRRQTLVPQRFCNTALDKIAHGFCSDWGAELFAQMRSLVCKRYTLGNG
ncbi:MAG TPA: hypothetical protein V6C84_02460 [Coleofasciculaceae cyanobacterium]